MEAYFKTQVIVGNIGCWWVLVHSGHYLLLTIHGPQTSTFLAQLLHLLDDSIRPWYCPSLWWWVQMEGWEGQRTHEAVASLRRVTRGSQSDFFLGAFGRLLCHSFLFDPALPSHQRRPVSPRILVPLTNIHEAHSLLTVQLQMPSTLPS